MMPSPPMTKMRGNQRVYPGALDSGVMTASSGFWGLTWQVRVEPSGYLRAIFSMISGLELQGFSRKVMRSPKKE